MFDQLIHLDKELLVFLNNLGNESMDGFWLFITKQFNWIPFFLVVLFLFFKHLGWKKGLVLMLFLAVLITFSDQFVNMIRAIFERLRPNNDPELEGRLRTLINPQNYSFVSGHATTSTAVAVFAVKTLRKHTKLIYGFILFPVLFAYSRLYLGVHFPIDILTGVCIGLLIGSFAAILFKKLIAKIS